MHVVAHRAWSMHLLFVVRKHCSSCAVDRAEVHERIFDPMGHNVVTLTKQNACMRMHACMPEHHDVSWCRVTEMYFDSVPQVKT